MMPGDGWASQWDHQRSEVASPMLERNPSATIG
jgi:hypothetical protein